MRTWADTHIDAVLDEINDLGHPLVRDDAPDTWREEVLRYLRAHPVYDDLPARARIRRALCVLGYLPLVA